MLMLNIDCIGSIVMIDFLLIGYVSFAAVVVVVAAIQEFIK